MDLLPFLRGATLVALVALAVSLWWLAVAFERRLPQAQRRSWIIIACTYSAFTIDFLLGEMLSLLYNHGHRQAYESIRPTYNLAFVLSAVLDAALPAVLLAVPLAAGRGRYLSLFVVVAIVCASVWGVEAGALRDWNILLTATQVISFLGIAAYLLFCALVVLGRLPAAGVHLAGFVAVAALFNVLLPVQEAIFQLVGRNAAAEIWHLNQFLQFARMAAQLTIVLLLVNTLAKAGRPLARAPIAG
ncbi:MAG TPA: hypothetical protein VF188_15085 [Longimicrobiales bacterium]